MRFNNRQSSLRQRQKLMLLGSTLLAANVVLGQTTYTMNTLAGGTFAGSAGNWFTSSTWTPAAPVNGPAAGDTAAINYFAVATSNTQSNIFANGSGSLVFLNNINVDNTSVAANTLRLTANGTSLDPARVAKIDANAGPNGTSTWATAWTFAGNGFFTNTGIQAFGNGSVGTLQLNNNLLITNLTTGSGATGGTGIHSVVDFAGFCTITGSGNIIIKADKSANANADAGVRLEGLGTATQTPATAAPNSFVGNWIVDGASSKLYVSRDNFGDASNGVQLKNGGFMDLSVSGTINTWSRTISGTGTVKVFTQAAANGLTLDSGTLGIAGSGASADQLTFTNGPLNLTSTSKLTLSGTFNPGTYTIVSDTAAVATGSPINGTFDTSNIIGLPAGASLTYNSNSIVLNVVSLTPQWSNPSDGDWNVASNWSTNSVPNAVGAEANFNATNSGTVLVYADTPVTVGTLKFNSPNQFMLGGAGSLTIQVASGTGSVSVLQGSHEINLPLVLASDTSIDVASSATLTIGNPMTIKTGKTVTKSGTFTMQAPLTIEANGTLTLAGGLTELFLAPNLETGARINVQNHTVTVSYLGQSSAAPTIKSQLTSGYASGAWNGSGIETSAGTATTGLGWKDVPASSAITIKYTYYGDADLSGTVDSSDFNALAAAYGTTTGAIWVQGDFNYDGKISTKDFNFLAGNFGLTIPAAAPTIGAVVPEPVSIAGITAGITGLLLRRSSKRRVSVSFTRG